MTGWARDARYSNVAIAFHWTIAVLVIANLIIGIGHDGIPALRKLMGAHKAIGLTVLALTVARVAWRMAHRPPPLPPRTPGWEKGLAHAMHWSLYLLMLAMPLTGWLMVSGPPGPGPHRPLSWFGLFDVPKLPASAGAADLGHDAHGLLGWVMLALVVLHVAAALRHHLILRDTVLARMAPALRRRGGTS